VDSWDSSDQTLCDVRVAFPPLKFNGLCYPSPTGKPILFPKSLA